MNVNGCFIDGYFVGQIVQELEAKTSEINSV